MRTLAAILGALILAIQAPLWLGKGGWLRVWDVDRQLQAQRARNTALEARNANLARTIAERAEEYLTSLCRTFLGNRAWVHVIPITVYKNHDDYVAAGNPPWSGGGTSFAFESKGPLDWKIKRSIDLFQLDASGALDPELIPNTLPHELTHLVLSEHFGENPTPLWLTEGLAQLMEAVDPTYYDKLVVGDRKEGSKFYVPLDVVLAAKGYPEGGGQKYLFYRESASFMRFLLDTLSRERFFEFVDDSKKGFTASAILSRLFAAPQAEVVGKLEQKWLDGLMARYGAEVKGLEDAEKGRRGGRR